MAENSPRFAIVDTVDLCVSAVDDLSKEGVISVHAEGVNVGKTGPLTLLQIGKNDGFVYLFNVFAERRLFSDGGLKNLLQNPDIIKVMYACSYISAALKCQFDVLLTNVFDIQAAQLIVEMSQGRELEKFQSLSELCGLYTDVTILDGRDELEVKLQTTEADYWAKQQLTPEMIDYACSAVRVMVPEVYDKLNSLMEENRRWREFHDRVKFEVHFRWDKNIETHRSSEVEAVKRILRRMEIKYDDKVTLDEVKDADELQALKRIRSDEITDFSRKIQDLRIKLIRKLVQEIRQELEDKGDRFIPTRYHFDVLLAGKKSRDRPLQRDAEELDEKLEMILEKHLCSKYSLTTPGAYLSEQDKSYLRGLQASRRRQGGSSDVLMHLHDVSIAADVEEIEEMRREFKKNPPSYKIDESVVKRLRYFMSAPHIPQRLKETATVFIKELQNARVVADPRRRR